MIDCDIFDLGDFALQSGAILTQGRLAFKTYGKLNSPCDNVIVYPTSFASTHINNEPMVGADKALDPSKYFIIIPNLLGNGLSSSPSNSSEPQYRCGFPKITYYDVVVAQHRLLTEYFGINRVKLVCGGSMGAQQVFHWGALYPDMVDSIARWCGSAKASVHNFVFLEGVKAALKSDSSYNNGCYLRAPHKGLKAMSRVYAGWGPSQDFYRDKIYLKNGFASIEEYISREWESRFVDMDANDLLSMITTWQEGDISNNHMFQGDIELALSSIKAKGMVMPSQTDQYFPKEDSEKEVLLMSNAELRVIPSKWGHLAGVPGKNPVDTRFIDSALKELLLS